jgi:hypothetical protein
MASIILRLAASAIALALAACVLPDPEGGAGGGGGDAGAGGGATDAAQTACERDSGTCEVCAQCAAAGPCVELVNACGFDAECSTLDQCLGLCGGEPECADGCYMQYSGAVELHGRAMGCVYCDQCASDCGANPSCI